MTPAEMWEWEEPTEEQLLEVVKMKGTEGIVLTSPLTREQWHLVKWCDGCKLDDHHKCTGVDCYGCQHPYHRFRGIRRLGNREEW